MFDSDDMQSKALPLFLIAAAITLLLTMYVYLGYVYAIFG